MSAATDACARLRADRDQARAQVERVRSLADEYAHRYDAGDHMLGCPDGAGYYDLVADEIRAALDGAS
jgi:queuine/archaeosine tRNA-ribosyltransferase